MVSADAIISISPVVIDTKPGFSGKAQGLLQTNRGNTNSDNYGGGLRIKYDNGKQYVIWSEFNINYASASGKTNADNTFLHTRYIHVLISKKIDWEIFIQSQTNQFTDIKQRILEGGDIRWHFKNQKVGNLFIGTGGFYEHISYTTPINPTENNIRFVFYISYIKTLNKISKFSYIGYYEPKVNKLSDHLISNIIQFKMNIYKHLFLSFEIKYNIDSAPAVGVKKDDFTQTTSFIYHF